MARVLAISSQVVRGAVGLSATVPALQSLGHEVWAVPTVLLANRPGLGDLARHAIPAADLAACLVAAGANGAFDAVDAVMTGYFPDPGTVEAAATIIADIKSRRARCFYLCDPILGDGDHLYVSETTAECIRDRLIPMADAATPNVFELSWLTGSRLLDLDAIATAARTLGPATVVVTSAERTNKEIATLLSAPTASITRRSQRYDAVPNGIGDVFAGLYLGHLLHGKTAEAALDASLGRLDHVAADSVGHTELRLAALHDA